jgi:hypothetical protein
VLLLALVANPESTRVGSEPALELSELATLEETGTVDEAGILEEAGMLERLLEKAATLDEIRLDWRELLLPPLFEPPLDPPQAVSNANNDNMQTVFTDSDFK